jgi:DNA-binding Lrp family transcriptional regulator
MMLTEKERMIGGCIQRDLAVTRHPYRAIAERTGIPEQDVLHMIRQMMKRGMIRKFGAIVRHREAGFTGNAMVVWAVPEDRCEQVGQFLSSIPEITHCYERSPAFEGKYNIFSMIHMRNHEIEKKIENLSIATGIQDYQILMSEEEFKKSSMEYFT